MQPAPLSAVRARIRIGAPLAFSVRDADQTLLLARGHTVHTQEQLEALFTRGALVDLAELAELTNVRDQVMQAPREQLPRLWKQCLTRMGQTLMASQHEGFRDALDDAATPVLGLVERDPDLAIFQILRQGNADVNYGAQRSLHAAITSWLVAQRIGWSPEDALKGFKVALTMNLSMLELQGQLARQAMPPTPQQRADLQSHPQRSLELLQAAGVADEDWLQAVLNHHETEDGGGYPSGRSDVGELASLVRRADAYTAKLSARGYRSAMAADLAGRQMFMQDPGHPMTAALVKEFGIYPPGCHVRLASGELAIVVQRGETVTTPVVACLTNARGAPLPQPLRLQTRDRQHAIVGIVGEKGINVTVTAEKLLAAGVT
jgi:HD-GYP domain-containing protein (c-di-GMP phosphodiesterase class II)